MKLPRFGVEEWLNTYEKSATHDIAGVSISALTLAELFELTGDSQVDFLEQVSQTKLDYGWIEGSPQFKEEVSKWYSNTKPQQILATNGATGANLLALYALIEPGDHVISLYPTYQQLYDIPKSLGAEVDFWEVKEELNWLPDLEGLRKLIRPNTKMICINNANNPFGALMDRAFLEELVTIADQVGAYILSDEVYPSFQEGLDVPAIVDIYSKGISINSLSKSLSLPGIRVGWVAANLDVIDLLRDYRDYTLICTGVFDDLLATYALQHKELILERNRQIVETNFSILEKWLAQEPKASAILPEKVSTSFVKLDVEQPIEEFCIRLLNEEGVLLVPGSRFGIEGHVRLGYCGSQKILSEALEKLSKVLHTK
ncbi:aminotransferase [Streptococcus loxodontisalivarius]|uniref:Aminotransferase n=1 Tax=Streptococcus loxodontisalivarius TaxID=1349415 RepID=A0ABS2PQU2_9STRE|nr:aminotransferase [Streptococcus loxodontisalivarius]MBM7642414.1 aspartate/methionine/tyrosine aminotransferase [Streptococcus loxodontisalivarius]